MSLHSRLVPPTDAGTIGPYLATAAHAADGRIDHYEVYSAIAEEPTTGAPVAIAHLELGASAEAAANAALLAEAWTLREHLRREVRHCATCRGVGAYGIAMIGLGSEPVLATCGTCAPARAILARLDLVAQELQEQQP